VGMPRVEAGPAGTKLSPVKDSGPATPAGSRKISPWFWTKGGSVEVVLEEVVEEEVVVEASVDDEDDSTLVVLELVLPASSSRRPR